MISLSSVMVLIAVSFVIWFWQDTSRTKELAIAAAKNACQQHQLQFLDGSVSHQSIRLQRGNDAKRHITRTYRFEFYNGDARLSGKICIANNKVIALEFETIDKIFSGPSAANDESNVVPFRRK